MESSGQTARSRPRSIELDNDDTHDSTVDTDGKKGERTIAYREVRHDGKLVKRTEKSSKITTRSRDKVVLVGTKEDEVASSGSTSGSSSTTSGGGRSGTGSSGASTRSPAAAGCGGPPTPT